MFKTSFKIATVWGIPIKVHISLLIMFMIFTSDFGTVDGVLLMIALLISVALHELGHSFVAINKGCRVREITLMMLGGAAQMESMPRKPMDEVLMALAGPFVSLILSLIGITAGIYIPPAFQSVNRMPILLYFGVINAALLIFNLIPAFPMDGGRVLRALLTPKMGKLKATRIAAKIGKGFAIFLGIIGLFGIGNIPPNFFYVLLAFFLYTIANREYRMVQIEENMKKMGGMGTDGFGRFGGFDFSSLFNTTNSHPQSPSFDDDDDTVTISPPPYKKGPDSKAEIHEDKKNPFGGIFGG